MKNFDTDQDAYKAFRDIVAERTRSVVAWTGAGLSAPAQIPTWPALREQLCNRLSRQLDSLSDGGPAKRARLDLARVEENLWLAFEILRDTLGETSFREAIRGALKPADSAAIPEAYQCLWKLPISGILNLNLDRLATRAHSLVRNGTKLFEFDSRSAGPSLHLLKSPFPFIANLHGVVENMSTWVFTKDDMQALLSNHGYRHFIEACLTSRTVLFIGVSADDLLAGGHVERLTQSGLDLGEHFWITNRNDATTRRWAEAAGVQLILYSNPDGQHTQLVQFLNGLREYAPQEDNALPVRLEEPFPASASIPAPADLLGMSADEIRYILNARAIELLSGTNEEKYDRYAAFCEEYEEAIYRAWFVSTNPPNNKLLGFTLLDRLATGAFGTVYTAAGEPATKPLAIKVLREAIRTDSAMLQGFRRGVASMKILARHGLPGVVNYRDASEIPAFVVMEYVEGPSIQEAVSDRRLTSWPAVLRAGVELAKIIHSSHQLPERVLHRDIRPSNVMLKNGWLDEDLWQVVVLDFDLSWHKDAHEVSVASPGSENSYLAPEQTYRSTAASTRNALVDSYGLGMTLYYLRTGVHPTFLQPQHADWQDVLDRATASHSCNEWASLPARYFRLVSNAVRPRQAERWDMQQILGELERLQEAVTKPTNVVSAEMIAEELARRSFTGRYSWNADDLIASIETPTGLTVSIRGDEIGRRIWLEAGWQQMGSAHHAKIRKWLPGACDKARSVLYSAEWRVDGISRDVTAVKVGASINSDS